MYSYTSHRLMSFKVSCVSTHSHQQKLKISEIFLSTTYTSNHTVLTFLSKKHSHWSWGGYWKFEKIQITKYWSNSSRNDSSRKWGLRSELHELINCMCNKENLPQQLKELIILPFLTDIPVCFCLFLHSIVFLSVFIFHCVFISF